MSNIIDYSSCINKLKENIEKVGEQNKEDIQQNKFSYNVNTKSAIYDLVGLKNKISMEDIENKILKPSVEKSSNWSCGFTYTIQNKKGKPENVLFDLYLNDAQDIPVYKMVKPDKDTASTQFVVKEDNIKHTDGILNISDLSDKQYNEIVKLFNVKDVNDDSKKSKKVSANKRTSLLLNWCFANNILTDSSPVKCVSFYLNDKVEEHIKSTELFYKIFDIAKGSYEGKSVMTILDNVQGYLATRPDIKCKLMIYRESNYIRVDFVRDDNKENLYLIPANVSKKIKEQKMVELIKSQKGYREYSKRDFLRYCIGNSSRYYCNDNATVRAFNEMLRDKKFQSKYNVNIVPFDVDSKGKCRCFIKIRKGPDWDDVYFAFNGEYIEETVITEDINKNNIEREGNVMNTEEPKRTRRTYTKEFHNYAIEVMDREGITEKYLRGEEKVSIDVDGAVVIKAMREKFTDCDDVTDMQMWKSIKQSDLSNRFKDVDKKKALRKLLKQLEKGTTNIEKEQKVKKSKNKKETEILHIIRFVVNLECTTTQPVTVSKGFFKRKDVICPKFSFIKHLEEQIVYYGDENKDEYMVEERLKELTNITSNGDNITTITPKLFETGKTYSIIESKVEKVIKSV